LFGRVHSKIGQIELPPGYSLEWGGEHEDSRHARTALARPLPMAMALMVLIVICLFNSFRTTAVIWITAPLCIIGVTGGLLITGLPFGFMTLLGMLSLVGEQIKNSIVVMDKVKTEIEKGKEPYLAILDGSVTKFRPVLMVAITTVLGMIPLLFDPFFASMAAALMFGLLFACVLTMIVAPTLYCIFFGIHEKA
jgi:multidrug efflux pump subunit AcrB